ncbi:MAG: hypothetical protein MI924_17165 [Chloroflexales bacterium]|nr:hypothetical protein [Chloroflexales bacterium]
MDNTHNHPFVAALREQTPIYIETLGALMIYRNGIAAPWKGGGVGAKQLQRMAAYLIAHRDRYVSYAALIEIAGGRQKYQPRCRPNYVIGGLKALCKNLGMTAALRERGSTLALCRHALWHTDTAALRERFDTAMGLAAQGQHDQAIVVSNEAALLCKGDYLPDFDAPGGYSIIEQADYWTMVQKQLFQTLTRSYLAASPDAAPYEAYLAARRAIDFDQYDPYGYELAAEVVQRCGHEQIAGRYRRQAELLRRKQ